MKNKNIRSGIRKKLMRILYPDRPAGIAPFVETKFEKILSLIKQVVEEVIGKDEEEVENEGTFNMGANYRNELRLSQRKKLKELLK